MTPLDRKDDLLGDRLRPVLLEAWFPRSATVGWHAVSLRGTEAISAPYEFEVALVNDDPMADHEELLGADCELMLDRNGSAHVVYGIVAEVEMLTLAESGRRADHAGSSARIKVVPAFWLLDQVIDTRFFAGQTVPEILREVLTPALADYERQVDCESLLKGQYNRRDYCVQFRESTFAFCSRIMEEEGIAYLFVPDDDAQCEKMILVDNNEDFAAVELLVPGEVPVVLSRADELDRESIQAFDWRRAQATNRVVTRGYNLKVPKPIDEGRAEQLDARRPVAREVSIEDDRRQIIDDPVDDPEAQSFTGAELAQRSSLATRVLQRHTLESAIGRGRSNAVGFTAGRVFLLGDHPDVALAHHKFVLVRVSHESAESGDGESLGHIYINRFECIPLEQSFRPALRTPRPHVNGVQTGVVVGRAQDEVYTDQFGRVRVKFHRDRHSADDEHASCWIRVAQQWAGPGYGSMVIPRVGMEVIVSFVDGNPDCPLVTGCVYNGTNMPPYALPSELGKSTFKTSSTPGGDGFSELRIDDSQGSEQIFVHAQRRMDLRVRGSLFETTGGSREERVGGGPEGERRGDHNTLVHKDVNHHVMETRYLKIDNDQYTSVGRDVVEDYHERHSVFVGNISQLSAPRIVVESSEYISHKSDELELAGSSTINLKGGGKVVIESNNVIELRVGASFISISPDGIDIQGLPIRLNSGGGVGRPATEGIPAMAIDLLEPLDALGADDGRPGGGGGRRGGGGGGRQRNKRTLEPHHAPKMKPPPPPKPGKPTVLPDGTVRQVSSLAWVEEEAWCSEPVRLSGTAQGYDAHTAEFVTITNAADGAVVQAETFSPGSGRFEHSIRFTDVLPRRTFLGHETERSFNAEALGLTTPVPIKMRFIPHVPSLRESLESNHYARFDLRVEDYEVVVGGWIEYTRGWIYYIIQLGTLAFGMGGKIGGKIDGSDDWRYCKLKPETTEPKAENLLFWDGAKWRDVPTSWQNPNGTKLSGMAVWKEPVPWSTNPVVRTQDGTIPWPDPVAAWTERDDTHLKIKLKEWKEKIEQHWTGKHDIKRNECASHDSLCCRYTVRIEVNFVETKVLREGVIVAPNYGRANDSAWPITDGVFVGVHEFGHHLGNPDEYVGASTVDPTVNADGARAGLDDDSIMGGEQNGGGLVRARHYNGISYVLSKAVKEHTGKSYTYKPVARVRR